MRIIFLILFFLISINAQDITKTAPIMAYVKNVPKGDVLNIRTKPSFRSPKVGYLKNGEDVEVFKCVRVGSKSIWCKVGFFGIKNYEGYNDIDSGWVNAKYLDTTYSYFVSDETIENEEDYGCFYSMGCKNGFCDVFRGDKTYKIKRSHLRAFFPYGGHCDYINKALSKKTSSSKNAAKEIISALKNCNVRQFKRYIHPKRGVMLSYFPDFYRVKNTLSKSKFAKYYKSGKKLYWGESEGRGDKIYLSLRSYCKQISKAVKKPKQLKKVSLKQIGFAPISGAVAYKFSKQKSYGWSGAILVLKKYNGKWYLIGLAYDRWTI